MAISFSRGDSAADVPQSAWLFFRGYFSWLFFSWLFFPWLFLGIGVAIFVFAWLLCRGYFFWRGYFCMAIFRHRGAMTCDSRHEITCLASHCLSTLLVWPRRSRHLNNYCLPWVREALVFLRCPWQCFALNWLRSTHLLNFQRGIRRQIVHDPFNCYSSVPRLYFRNPSLYINTGRCQFLAPSRESW